MEVPVEDVSELVPFLRVALSWSKALMKLALVSRSSPSKALWCLAFAKIVVRDPSLIQVYDVHLQPLCCVLASVLFPASMSVLLLMFCLSFPELSMFLFSGHLAFDCMDLCCSNEMVAFLL
ncbi:hypothetical protein V6N13_140163 [Hibiscus sabdariffa]